MLDMAQSGDAIKGMARITQNPHPDVLENHVVLDSRSITSEPDSHADIDSQTFHRALELMRLDYPLDTPSVCSCGLKLWQSHSRSGDLDELNAAIFGLRRVFQLPPENGMRWVFTLSLGHALHKRVELFGKLKDLEDAIRTQRSAVELMSSSGDPDQIDRVHVALMSLGDSLLERFNRLDNSEDLESAVSVFTQAVERCDHDSCRFQALSQLARAEEKLSGSDEMSNLRIVLLYSWLKAYPEQPVAPRSLLNIKDSGDSPSEFDLANIVSGLRKLCQRTPDSAREKPEYLGALGYVLNMLFERDGDTVALDRSIHALRCAVKLARNDPSERSRLLLQLGDGFFDRFTHELACKYLEVSAFSDKTSAKPQREGERSKRPFDFAYIKRGQRKSGVVYSVMDCKSVLSMFRETSKEGMPLLDAQKRIRHVINDLIGLHHDAHSDSRRASGLGICWNDPWQQSGIFDYLDKAISAFREADEGISATHLEKHDYLEKLGDALRVRLEASERILTAERMLTHDFDESLGCFMEVTMNALMPPAIRLSFAGKAIRMMCENTSILLGSSSVLRSAQTHILDIFPKLVWLGNSISKRFAESARLGELVNDAVRVAVGFGDLNQAVEWFEAGRALVLSQALSLRTALCTLKVRYPKLAESLEIIHLELLHSGTIASVSQNTLHCDIARAPQSAMHSNILMDQHRQLVFRFEDLLTEVRSCLGFENFLRPNAFSALVPSGGLSLGTMVLINSWSDIGYALVICDSSSQVQLIELPSWNHRRASTLLRLWKKCLTVCRVSNRTPNRASGDWKLRGSSRQFQLIMKPLWESVVHPILKILFQSVFLTREGTSLPHVTWCSSGPLAQLPLHAAGVYGEDHMSVYDFVVSSYAPSIAMLLRSGERLAETRSRPNVLIVSQPETPGQAPLPGTVPECAGLLKILSAAKVSKTVLEGPMASVNAVRATLSDHSWVHFACHGSQHATDPAQSALELYDGRLSLPVIMSVVADKAELAFLSACQTATGDEKIPEESAHLAAGMLSAGFKGVVATMWSINDKDAPVVVKTYYEKLISLYEQGEVGRGTTGAAYALHEATKHLRETVGESAFERWVPFVHFGV